MAGDTLDRGEGIHVLCRWCGRPWPASYRSCPDDGTALTPRRRSPNIHIAETLILPGARRPSGTDPTAALTDSTTIDGVALGETGAAVELDAEPGPSRDAHRFLDSEPDAQTDAFLPRVGLAQPAPRTGSAGPGSSDPPTSFLRRGEGHIYLPPGSVVNNEYEIDACLGTGSMGEVYSARHLKLGKRVAIKVMAPRLSEDPGAVERFEQEARTLARIHHPGIVDVLGFGELADGRAYFVMEHLSGEPLDQILGRGRLPSDEALDILDQMARALEAAHAHHVIHRDLKPANIYIVRLANEPRPIVKLLDFGLAKLASDVDARAERTQSGAVIGTAPYLSPEQCRGPDVDHRTDIYALGCTAYELLLGRPPFDEKTVAALIAAHLHQAPPMPRALWPGIPAQLDLVLFAMLAKDPAYRPTLAQLRQVIASVSAARPAALATPRPGTLDDGARRTTATESPRMSRAATAGLTAAGLIGGILIGALALGSRSSSTPRRPLAPGVTAPGDASLATAPVQGAIDAGGVVAAPAHPADAGAALAASRAALDAGAAPPHDARSTTDAGATAIAPPCQPPGPNIDPFGPPLCTAADRAGAAPRAASPSR